MVSWSTYHGFGGPWSACRGFVVSLFKVSVDIGQFCNVTLATRLVAPEAAVAATIKIAVGKSFSPLVDTINELSRSVNDPAQASGRPSLREEVACA